MRDLVRSSILPQAAAGAAFTAFAAYSRLFSWHDAPIPLWALIIIVFACSTVLWAFVFAWHEKYSNRPVLNFSVPLRAWMAAILCGLSGGVLMHFFVDPMLRPLTPELYPGNFFEWSALLLFKIIFVQLFFCFAPMAFFLRLLPSIKHAAAACVGLGIFVSFLKISGLQIPVPAGFALAILAARGVSAALSVWFYVEGGILLSTAWIVCLELRHFATL